MVSRFPSVIVSAGARTLLFSGEVDNLLEPFNLTETNFSFSAGIFCGPPTEMYHRTNKPVRLYQH
jgi:hypothetical protein